MDKGQNEDKAKRQKLLSRANITCKGSEKSSRGRNLGHMFRKGEGLDKKSKSEEIINKSRN